MSERGEQYTRGEGDEDIARMQPGYVAPGPGVTQSDSSEHCRPQLVWSETAFQVCGSDRSLMIEKGILFPLRFA